MKRKQRSTIFTEAKRRNARENISRHSWAREQAETTIARAEVWAGKSDEELWEFVPGHTLRRYIHVNTTKGCPECGPAVFQYGSYDWITDPHEMPWKVKCPNCSEIFPKNDFGAYYRSGLDQKGIFRQELADRDLLLNAEHPDRDDSLHQYGVDDGSGWEDFTFIAYYMHWGVWANLAFVGNQRAYSILRDLSQASCFTASSDRKLSGWGAAGLELKRTDGKRDIFLDLLSPEQEVYFSEITFQGRIALLTRDTDGALARIFVLSTSALTVDGVEILRSERSVKEVSVQWRNQTLEVHGEWSAPLAIYAPHADSLIRDGVVEPCKRQDDYVVL